MGFDFTKNRAAGVPIVILYADYPSTPLRLAMGETVNTDDKIWQGRIDEIGIAEIDEAFPAGFQVGLPLPEITLTLNNRDGFFDSYLESSSWFAGMPVLVYYWLRGSTIDYVQDCVFVGRVKFPNGCRIENGTIALTVSDWREKLDRDFPPKTFDVVYFKDMDTNIQGKIIPVLYGDFSYEKTPDKMQVEAFCVDRAPTGGDVIFKICDPNPNGIGWIDTTLYVDHGQGTAFVPVAVKAGTIDLVSGYFSIDRSLYTWTDRDRFWIAAKGNLDATGQLITNPADVIRDLIIHYSNGGTTFDIDAATYATVRAAKSYHKVRAQITDSGKLMDVISELGFEAGIDLMNVAGAIGMVAWNPVVYGNAANDLNDVDIVDGSFKTEIDPDALYTPKVQGNYLRDPYRDKYVHSKTYDNSATAISKVDMKTFDMLWYFTPKGVKERLGRLAWLFEKGIRVYTFQTGFKAMKWRLGDVRVISCAVAGLDHATIQVRGLKKNLNTGIVEVTAWDSMIRSGIGRWTAATAHPWSTATAAEKKANGFWTDAAGLADPADPTSDASHWI